MTEQAFSSVWGLSYSDFEFLNRFGMKSQVMIACQLLYFRQYVKTRMVQSVLRNLDVVACLSPEDYRNLSPLIYLHINPYGRFEVDLDKRIDFEPLAA